VVHIKYLGTKVKNQNLIHVEVRRRLNSSNVRCNSVQNILSPCLLSKNIRIYKTVFLILCGIGTWSLTLKEEHLLRVFENRDEVTVVEK
jgi:hypothetical protein